MKFKAGDYIITESGKVILKILEVRETSYRLYSFTTGNITSLSILGIDKLCKKTDNPNKLLKEIL